MISFKQFFLTEVTTNGITPDSKAKWDTGPKKGGDSFGFDSKKEKVIGTIGRHKVLQQTVQNQGFGSKYLHHHFLVRGPWLGLGKVSLTTIQHFKRDKKKGKITNKLEKPNDHPQKEHSSSPVG